MNSIRVKFIRGEEVKYISHLDMMKLFERAARRGNIPISYSQGFNPHPNMVFGLPLSVGVTSESEYADFELLNPIEPSEFSKLYNGNLPDGLKITEAMDKTTKSNIMATIAAADYEILVASNKKHDMDYINDVVGNIMSKDGIFVSKESKRSKKDVDIRPMIYSLDIRFLDGLENHDDNGGMVSKKMISNPFMVDYIKGLYKYEPGILSYDVKNLFCISAKLGAGSKSNLKPDLLISAFNLLSDLELKLVKVHRTGLYIERESRILDPMSQDALS
ncbi:MAG TPA: TIGR03936 family radical SAM-associated protein [Pseudobacteroides sp.]|uniref:TIGR03936 family radical SAM-associated protein n=1 Tax=Pseudobacteroides sp. TaxID=1968840 RepID=UPI002F941165